MIDPIKQFVEQNRAAFDDKEPPADAMQQIRNRLKAKAAEEKKVVFLFGKTKWLVAASVLLAVATTFILINRGSRDIKSNQLVHKAAREIPKKENVTESDLAVEVNTSRDNDTAGQKTQTRLLVKTVPVKRKTSQPVENSIPEITGTKDVMEIKDLYASLADSSSASVRLAAILEIDRTNTMNQHTLDGLSKTLNNDSNSNVRLAALNVMRQYANNKYVSSLLVESLATQKDPLIQLGLIDLLGKLDNVKIEDRLFALADDPDTFGAVKDEAYLVLLNQNKL